MMEFKIGVDDAGRGPVIGPMVLAGVVLDEEGEDKLKKMGVKDSKQLTPKRREYLAEQIKKIAKGDAVEVITAGEINRLMNDKINLNVIEAKYMGRVINKLAQGLSEEERNKVKVIIDCPSVNTKSWLMKLHEFVRNPEKITFLCEHKADINHLVVSAASVIAKVRRDKEIEKIKKEIGEDFGSGYSSDPKTKEFTERNHDRYSEKGIFRTHWETIRRLKEPEIRHTKQKKLMEY